ncbi:MAG TPA: hypothetical protein VIM02_01425 [Rhizomicrobium sp.]|jgi:hypothetical protein
MTNTPNMKPAETAKVEPAVLATNQPATPVKAPSSPEVLKTEPTSGEHKPAQPAPKS